jgi:hypothetical protein
MAAIKRYTSNFSQKDLSSDDILTLTFATTIATPLYAVIAYSTTGISTAPTGLKKISDTSVEVNVSECPTGTHIIHIFYEI